MSIKLNPLAFGITGQQNNRTGGLFIPEDEVYEEPIQQVTPEETQGIIADFVDKVQQGAYGSAADMLTGVRGLLTDDQVWEMENYLREGAAAQAKTLSPEQIAADENFAIFGDDGEFTGRGFMGALAQGLGSIAPSMVAGGGAGLIGKQLLGRAGQVLAGGAVGAPMIGGGAMNQVEEELNALSPEQFAEIPEFAPYYNAFMEQYPEDPNTAMQLAQDAFKQDALQTAVQQGAVVGGLSMGAAAPMLGRILSGGSGTIKRGVAEGMGTEAAQEFVESGGQEAIVNPLVGRDRWENVLETAGEGAIIGGLVGGGVGGATSAISGKPQPEETSPPKLDERGLPYPDATGRIAYQEEMDLQGGVQPEQRMGYADIIQGVTPEEQQGDMIGYPEPEQLDLLAQPAPQPVPATYDEAGQYGLFEQQDLPTAPKPMQTTPLPPTTELQQTEMDLSGTQEQLPLSAQLPQPDTFVPAKGKQPVQEPLELPEQQPTGQQDLFEKTRSTEIDDAAKANTAYKRKSSLLGGKSAHAWLKANDDIKNVAKVGSQYFAEKPDGTLEKVSNSVYNLADNVNIPTKSMSKGELIKKKSRQVETEPTEAQKEAGNYKKAHVNVDGMDITIENPKGSMRKGTDEDGNKWENKIKDHYGYLKGTKGFDKDQVDVFINDTPNVDEKPVFIVDQINPKTGEFDEHKVMMGYDNAAEAEKAYKRNYARGWKGLDKTTEMSTDEFKKWIKSGKPKKGAVATKDDGMPPEAPKAKPIPKKKARPKATVKSLRDTVVMKPAKKAMPKKAMPKGKIGIAPNGKKSNLTNKQWKIVRTPTFKKWFGDWENNPENASKVVDENGEPMVQYHKSLWNPLVEKKGEAVFKVENEGDNTYGDPEIGIHFGTEEQANEVGTALIEGYEGKGAPKLHTSEVFLNIRNPLTLEDKTYWTGYIHYEQLQDLNIPVPHKYGDPTTITTKEILSAYKKAGYDGGTYLNTHEGDTEAPSYIVFDNSKIKSATDNVEFSPKKTDIRFAMGQRTLVDDLLNEFSIQGKKADYSIGRMFNVLKEYAYPKGNVKSSVVYINPKAFIEATTADPEAIYKASRDYYTQDKLEANVQTPFLKVEKEGSGYKIIGHEGRHRMAYLADQGVTKAPIVVEDYSAAYDDYQTNFNNDTVFKGQWEGTKDLNIDNPVGISFDNVDQLQDTFSSEADVKFNINELQSLNPEEGLAVTRVKQRVNQLTKGWQNPPIINVVEGTADLQPEVKKLLGNDNVASGFYYNGEVFLVADNLKSEQDLEETLMHESLGHYGMAQLFGKDTPQMINNMYAQLGGAKALNEIARKQGINLDAYRKALYSSAGPMYKLSPEQKKEILMEELLAHMVTNNTLPNKIKTFLGRVRKWLRKHGFNVISGYNDMDLFNVLYEAEQAVKIGNFTKSKTKKIPTFHLVTHGSPYLFRNFDTTHMGKGEGLQVYGWGMYMGEGKHVAKHYSDLQPQSLSDNPLDTLRKIPGNAGKKFETKLLDESNVDQTDANVENYFNSWSPYNNIKQYIADRSNYILPPSIKTGIDKMIDEADLGKKKSVEYDDNLEILISDIMNSRKFEDAFTDMAVQGVAVQYPEAIKTPKYDNKQDKELFTADDIELEHQEEFENSNEELVSAFEMEYENTLPDVNSLFDRPESREKVHEVMKKHGVTTDPEEQKKIVYDFIKNGDLTEITDTYIGFDTLQQWFEEMGMSNEEIRNMDAGKVEAHLNLANEMEFAGAVMGELNYKLGSTYSFRGGASTKPEFSVYDFLRDTNLLKGVDDRFANISELLSEYLDEQESDIVDMATGDLLKTWLNNATNEDWIGTATGKESIGVDYTELLNKISSTPALTELDKQVLWESFINNTPKALENNKEKTIVGYMQSKGLLLGEDLDEDMGFLEESYENGLFEDNETGDKIIAAINNEFKAYVIEASKTNQSEKSIYDEIKPLMEDQAAIKTLKAAKSAALYTLHDLKPADAARVQLEQIGIGAVRVANALNNGHRGDLTNTEKNMLHRFIVNQDLVNQEAGGEPVGFKEMIDEFLDFDKEETFEMVENFANNDAEYINESVNDYIMFNNEVFQKQPPDQRSVYIVDLKPRREQFLHWHKPLIEQSDYIIDRIEKATNWNIRNPGFFDNVDYTAYTGEDFVSFLEERLRKINNQYRGKMDTSSYDASMMLVDMEIPGSTHYDWQSKQGKGATQNWVVFREEDTEIIQTFTRDEWIAKMDEVYDEHPILPNRKDELGLLSRTTARLMNPTPKTDIEKVVNTVMGSNTKNIKVVQSQSELPKHLQDGIVQGAYDKGQVYLVADNIKPIQVKGLLLHEVGVHANMRDMLGQELYSKLEKRVKRMTVGSLAARRAYQKAIKFGVEPEFLMEETIAYMVEANPNNGFIKQAVSAIKAWLFKNYGIGYNRLTPNDIASLAKTALKHSAPMRDQRLYSLTATEDYLSFEAKIDPETKPGDSLKQVMKGFYDSFRTGVIDSYDSLKKLDQEVHGKEVIGDENISLSSWVLARMSHGSVNAVSAMLNYGRIKMSSEGLVMPEHNTESIAQILRAVGNKQEINYFMNWIAANRASELKKQGRENLFTDEEITAGMAAIDDPAMPSRRGRWEDAYKKFSQHQNDVLKIAVQSNILSEEEADKFAGEMYVPFYRVMEDDGDAVTGMRVRDSLARQQAYKKLKGGNQPLGNLLQNTIENFNHLLSASMKNNAAVQAMDNALHSDMLVAEETTEALRNKKESTFVLRDGKKVWYNINDPLVFNALSTLVGTGMNNFMMRIMRGFKRVFTNFTTATPQFIVANIIRDSVHTAAVANTGTGITGKLTAPVRGTAGFSQKNKMMHDMITSGGGFTFGHIYGDDADTILSNIDSDIKKSILVDKKSAVTVAKNMWDTYHGVANRGENANRYAVYEQAIKSGKTPLQSAFMSRDLMDFSSRGAWVAVRVLTDIVPFLNARIQGLDVLYRKGLKPTSDVLKAMVTGKDENITLTDKQAANRFMTVAGAVVLASMALYMAYKDDEDYKARADWDRDMYWWFKVGGNAFRIPKPFELGAIGTLAERSLQQMVDNEVTGKVFAERFGHMLSDTFAFNPIPQMLNPMINLYANKDDFTNSAIETSGMERLSPSLRSTAKTTDVAKGLSTGLEATFGNIFGKDSKLVLSPVQIDYLIQSYLGGVGGSVNMFVDDIFNIGDKPERKWFEHQPFRRFYGKTDLANARYISDVYNEADKASTAYADYRELARFGTPEKAQKFLEENREEIAKRKSLSRVKKSFASLNREMKRIRLSDIPSAEKRRLINILRKQKSDIAKMGLGK